MAVLLKNLVARTPDLADLGAISELIALDEGTRSGFMDITLESVLSHKQRPGFYLAADAWVIVTTRGQFVGFTCVWNEDYNNISMFFCVHPAYRNRGIGTLLVRLAEGNARKHVRLATLERSVALRALVCAANEDAQRLLMYEGYLYEREFLRISYALAG